MISNKIRKMADSIDKKGSKEGEKLRDFLEHHSGEIRGLYDDKYYKNGGWNGMMDAIDEVAKRYKFKYNPDDLDDATEIEGEFEEIINEVMGKW